MKFNKTLLALISLYFLIFSSKSLAQTSSSIDIIRKGVELYEKKDYEGSIEELKKVHRNDSNYYVASIEILISYLALNKDSLGLELCNHLLKLKNDFTPNILVYKADFLDNLKRGEEARLIYLQGIKDYPLNHSFYYEMGVVKMKENKFDEAYKHFIQTLKINPFHSASHFQLGLMARRQNNIIAAMLATQFYFLTDRTSDRAKSLIVNLEKVSKMEIEPDTVIILKDFENDFSELESILKSKVALSEKYKLKVDLNYDLVKQMQLVIENIGKYKDVKGFYNDYYGKFFVELQKEKMFEPYVYTSLSGLGIDKVEKWISKNKSDIEKFEDWCYNYICKNLANYEENLNGQKSNVPHWFSNGRIVGAGLRNNGVNEGYWNYYFGNGIKKAEGVFKNGLKDGLWKYYYKSGGIMEYVQVENGVEKSSKTYYENNNPKVELGILNNKINGEVKSFFTNGNIRFTRTYKDGKISGKETQYYRNSSLRYSIDNNDEIISGECTEYFDNGKIYQKLTFVNGLSEGPGKTFYNNDNNSIESEGKYVKGKFNGEWKFYHKNTKLFKQGSYNSSGEKEGVWKEFHDDGKLSAEEIFVEGKMSGLQKYYDLDGNLWQEYTYKKNKLLEYRAYKKDGSKICDNKVNGKNFQLVLYHANSQKRREGKVSDGELEGVWKDYSIYGVLSKECNYKEGKLHGTYNEYYPSGKIKAERNFEDNVESGYYKSYFVNGQLGVEGQMTKGNNEGYWKYYFINGTTEKVVYFVESNATGWIEFYNVNGKLDEENYNSEDCLVKVVYHDSAGVVTQNVDLPGGTGTIIKKSLSGNVYFQKEFVKDYAENLQTTFYPDGKIETQVTCKKGKKEGKQVVYDELGRLKRETPFFNNAIDGKRLFYHDNGKLDSEFELDNGEYNGKGVTYHENGKILRDYTYKNGHAEGESNMYDEFGELVYKRTFFNDLLINYTYKDATGKFVKPIEPEPGQSKVVCYFQNGKKSLETNYFNGDMNGKRIVYFSNGNISSESDFYFDNENGLSKEYYASGKLKSTTNYYYGVLNGIAQEFYENGTLKSDKNYKLGQEQGWFKFYDDKAKLLKSVFYFNSEPMLIK